MLGVLVWLYSNKWWGMAASSLWGSIIGGSSGTAGHSVRMKGREGSVTHANVEILSSWLINSHWSEVPPIVLLHSPDLLTFNDSGIRVVSQQEAFRTLLPLCQLMRIKGEEEKPEDNVWLHICIWREDKEEPERQTHELFSVRRKCKVQFPFNWNWGSTWAEASGLPYIPGIVPALNSYLINICLWNESMHAWMVSQKLQRHF